MVKGLDTSKMQLFPIEQYTITVTDGDSLLLIGGGKKVSVRLGGIDTPELKKSGKTDPIQRMGQAGNLLGKRYLQEVVNKHRHELRLWIVPGKKSHGRVVGFLAVGNRNINLELVELGLARALTNPDSSTYTAASNSKAFKNAMEDSIASRRGIFKSKFNVAIAQETADVGGLSYVRMTAPEMLGKSFERRVRMQRVLKGMAQGDHRKSTYGGFIGMHTDRPDFGASSTPGNPASMAIIQKMFKGLGIHADLLMSMDIESTGLDFSDVTTFGGMVDVSPGSIPSSMETFVNPKLPFSTKENLGKMLQPGDHRFRNTAAQAAMKTGGQMTNVLPSGRHMDTQYAIDKLNQSSMSGAMRGEQLALVPGGNARGMDPEDFMRQVFNKFKGKKNGWVFIHNAQFESRMLGAAIPEDVWTKALESGDLASGNTSRRYLYNEFDKSLATHKQASRVALQAGDSTQVAKSQAAWLERFSTVFRNDPKTTGVASGVKVIDTQDIAKGVLAQAHLSGHFQPKGSYSTHGLVSQDALSTLLGMKAERHMPVADAEQNLEMVARMLTFSDEMKAGNLSKSGTDFFKKAGGLQKDMQIFSLYKDITNQLRGLEEGVAPTQHKIAIRGDTPTEMLSSEEGVSYIGGKARSNADMPSPSYPRYDYSKNDMLSYVKKRVDTMGLDLDPEEMIETAYRYKSSIGQVSPNEMIDALSDPSYQGMSELFSSNERAAAVAEAAVIKNLEMGERKVVGAGAGAVGAAGGIKSIANIKSWWGALQPKTRTTAKGLGVAAAVIGVLGFVRGLTEKEHDAQPLTMHSMEEYGAMKQQGVHNNHSDVSTSSMISSFRMVPNRYPTKVA